MKRAGDQLFTLTVLWHIVGKSSNEACGSPNRILLLQDSLTDFKQTLSDIQQSTLNLQINKKNISPHKTKSNILQAYFR